VPSWLPPPSKTRSENCNQRCTGRKADPGRRFHALYDKVYRRDVLERAWEAMGRNRDAAGIDTLAAALKDGRWRPLPARRVWIPKPGSPSEQRPLSIPGGRRPHRAAGPEARHRADLRG
jgi:hypothetical protein